MGRWYRDGWWMLCDEEATIAELVDRRRPCALCRGRDHQEGDCDQLVLHDRDAVDPDDVED
jgi:hypothetical protein